MPPRFPKPEKKKKTKPEPQTSDEWQDHGVFLEESGEKWRAGDSAKASRFYHRAAEAYQTALSLEPSNFDAAYNYARVLFVLATDERVEGEPGMDGENLERAVEAHRVAVGLREGNLDCLFNFGQAMAALGEYWVERRRVPVERRVRTVQMLEEAAGILDRVYTLSEERIRGDQEALKEAESEVKEELDGDEIMDKGEAEEQEEWAVVESPVNEDSLLDATLAHLEVLTQLAILAPENLGQPLSAIQVAGEGLIDRIFALFINHSTLSERLQESLLTRANFISALSDSLFKTGALPYETYAQALSAAYSTTPAIIPSIPTSALDPTSLPTLADTAAALVRFSTTITLTAPQNAWKHLTEASGILATASKLHPKEASRIFIGRGDIEVMRARLPIPAAEKNKALLWKNAAVYYKNAGALGGNAVREAEIKGLMVKIEMGEDVKFEVESIRGVVLEAVDEGVFGTEWFERVGIREI